MNTKILKINLGLLFLITIALSGYIFSANQLVSHKYALELLRKQLSATNIALESKNSAVEAQLTPQWLTAFARNRGMVEVKDNEALYEENGTAALSQANN